MEEVNPSKRSAKRTKKRQTGREPAKSLVKTIGLEEDAFSQLEASAKKMRMSKTKFASAAVTYFTENGLDPTKAGVSEIAQVRKLIGESNYEIRKQNVDIGNRLVTILRTWEANQYKFMQTQQGGLLGYLEDIEANILAHQVAVESQVLAPLFERVARNGVEAHLTRMLTEILLLKFDGKNYPFSSAELKVTNADYDGQRDRQLVRELQKLSEAATVAAPKRTQKPVLAVPIVGAPAKPAGAVASPNAASTQPKS